ncbi:glycosyltransferase family protein [Pusillimonas sp. CC-YST705]|uniref:Glycosyltransferase family protein n=1 Tax=Mesopusillimonas faecipullorum TaxID=2755040 RepID=A0ABS8CAJ6_9BURK|nr:glycosyltransferase family protein [Mesopusillimonas faecipullorum]MCB5363035.1 glycosyltransferase family protein [Mesopusillimonas faecipullorum]
MKTVVILQARFSSTRLPGKVLKVVRDQSILGWMIRLCKLIDGVDEVCVAVPEGAVHEGVAAEARRLGASVAYGPEYDVLARFLIAARQTNADIVMRITTDCPLADPAIASDLLRIFKEDQADYGSNNDPFSFPHGLDCEVFTRSVLERAADEAKDPYEREHVTPWMKKNVHLKKVHLHGPGGEMVSWRWTVDTPDDLEFFEAVAKHFDHAPGWKEIVAVLEANPELHDLNRNSRSRG